MKIPKYIFIYQDLLNLIESVVESGTPSLVQWLIEYTPYTNFYGQDSFTYKVTNPENSIPESEDGTIYINISPQNDAPIVYNNIFNQILYI